MQDISFFNKKELKIHANQWLPDNEIKSCILLLHGYAEHSGRYHNLVSQLTQAGHAVFAMDYEGHGCSEGVRGSVGSFGDMIADTALFFTKSYRAISEKPWFMLGHGLGGNIAIQLASMFPQYVKGLLLSAPAIMIDRKIPKIVQDMARNIAVTYSDMPVMRLDTRGISRVSQVVDEYNKDPLVYHGCLRAGMVLCFRQAIEQVCMSLSKLSLPVWVGHGSFDSLHDPAGSAYVINRIQSMDKTLNIFNNLFHEILNEPEHSEIIGEIINWVDERSQELEGCDDYHYSTMKTG